MPHASSITAHVTANRVNVDQAHQRRRHGRSSTTCRRATNASSPAVDAPADAFRRALEDLRARVNDALPVEARSAATRAAYASSASLRFAFFLSQVVSNSRETDARDLDVAAIAQVVGRVVLGTDTADKPAAMVTKTMDGEEMANEQAESVNAFLESNMGAILDVFKREMEFVEDGVYKFPYDMDPTTAPASQWNPVAVSALARANARDQREVAKRREAQKGQELRETYVADPKRYPDYYLQNFHYQTDGWLSAQSARLYDFQVECLFLGSADAMRRRALPYIADFMRNSDAKTTKHLDVASGTGRFLSFVRDNHPELQSTALELSPHYLEATRKINKRFEGKGGSLRLVEANAEEMPLEDNEFDMITNVYLFHELPRPVRVTVAKEMARVLKPGGKLFFVDSVQIGDGKDIGMESAYELAIDRFPAFNHEPYYKDYSVTNLVELFEEAGLRHEATSEAWVSKTMVFSKPFDGQDMTTASSEVVEPQEVEAPSAVVENMKSETTPIEAEIEPESSEPESDIGTRKF